MRTIATVSAVVLLTITSCGGQNSNPSPNQSGIHKIQHVVVIMQENRSFDHYFGTFPGADGLPRGNGQFTICVPDPAAKTCRKPFHDSADQNYRGPHGPTHDSNAINGGKIECFAPLSYKIKA